MKKHKVTATEAEKGFRIDQFLSQKIEGLSRNQARKALQRGGVYLGRKRIKICSYRIRGNENITIFVPPIEQENASPSEAISQPEVRAEAPRQVQKVKDPLESGHHKPREIVKHQRRKPSQLTEHKTSPVPKEENKTHEHKAYPVSKPSIPPHPELHLIEKDILFKDTSIIAVNKKNGIPSQGTRTSDDFTLGRLVEYYLHTQGENQFRVNLIHRLDQNSSGIMLFSRTKQANISLTDQFKKHTIQKNYLAIVCGTLDTDSGMIETVLNSHEDDSRSNESLTDNADTKAILTYEVLERFQDYLWLRISPQTGKTHQIRRQFAEKGLPLLGDIQYGGPPVTAFSEEFLFKNIDFDPHRFFLHSYSIGLQHPVTNMFLELVAPIPDDMKEVLNLLRNR
ncbi:hypothetical protein JXQ70_13730 [bacterium]|nr:hypothetical protein [bacterium]